MHSTGSGAVRAVIVDDSTFFRYQLRTRLVRIGWQVVASLATGEDALAQVPTIQPDVVLMDVIMPGMGGLEAVRQLRRDWNGPIIMISSQSEQGVRATWEAMDAGAQDFVAKPDGDRTLDDMIEQLEVRFRRQGFLDTRSFQASPAEVRTAGFRALVMGASTGGPKALSHLFETWRAAPPVPVLVVQHMPSAFTRSFAERLSALLGHPVVEAPPDGTPVPLAGSPVVVAAGGHHLRVSATSCWAEPGERRHGVIPSVDVTLWDAAEAFGRDLAAVILTGMGEDGAEGALKTRQRGGTVIAESADSALVWGMPGAVVGVGAADAVWPLDDIGLWLKRVTRRGGIV